MNKHRVSFREYIPRSGMLAVRNLCKFKFLGSGATLAWLWRTPPQPRSSQGKRKSVLL